MKKVLSVLVMVLLSTVLLTGCGATTNVYKTIDFNSYNSNSSSTEFDDLIDKKVTFTNVPTLAGMLGNYSKGITCRNESSLTIEDDVKYTVTGIVVSTSGTVYVTMKDCNITKE